VIGKNGYQLLLKMVRSLEGALQFYQVLQSVRKLWWLLVLWPLKMYQRVKYGVEFQLTF
jgi:hypothetical protein